MWHEGSGRCKLGAGHSHDSQDSDHRAGVNSLGCGCGGANGFQSRRGINDWKGPCWTECAEQGIAIGDIIYPRPDNLFGPPWLKHVLLMARAQRLKATLKIRKDGLSSVNSLPHRCKPDASVRAGRVPQSSVPPDRGSKDEHGYE